MTNTIVASFSMILATTMGLNASPSGINRIAGKWNNDRTGENIMVVPDPLGGWQFWSSDFGQARISSTDYQGANIKVEGRGLVCFYYATLTVGQKMNWQLRAGNPDCLARTFTRAE